MRLYFLKYRGAKGTGNDQKTGQSSCLGKMKSSLRAPLCCASNFEEAKLGGGTPAALLYFIYCRGFYVHCGSVPFYPKLPTI